MTATAMTSQRPFIIRAGRPSYTRNRYPRSMKFHNSLRSVRLFFDERGRLNPHDARTWARSIARDLWGPINGEYRLRSAALPGPAWWFSCSGHGGYILVADPRCVPPFFRRYAEDGSPVWSTPTPSIAAYVFEEDCNWAVLLAAYPAAASAEECASHRAIGPGGGPLWCHITDTVRRWAPPDVLDALLMRPALPAGPSIATLPTQVQLTL